MLIRNDEWRWCASVRCCHSNPWRKLLIPGREREEWGSHLPQAPHRRCSEVDSASSQERHLWIPRCVWHHPSLTRFSPTPPSAFFTLHVLPWSLLGVTSSLCPAPRLSYIPVSFLSASQAASASSALTLFEKVRPQPPLSRWHSSKWPVQGVKWGVLCAAKGLWSRGYGWLGSQDLPGPWVCPCEL